ncbi:MAG: hypothetical protein ACOCYP_10120 [Planctomycetota bacterium]
MRCAPTCLDITPPPGCILGGGAFGSALGAADTLQANVVLIEDEGATALLASCDLIGFGSSQAERLRRAMAEAAGIEPAQVLLAATHTHSGPVTMDLHGWGAPNPDYLDRLETMLRQAAATVARSDTRRPCSSHAGSVACPGFAVNRTSYGTECDEHLRWICLRDASGRPLVVIVESACHPVHQHGTGMISADYPGRLRRHLQDLLGASVPVLFLLGACGDINPRAFRFVPEEANDWRRRDAVDLGCAQHGQALAEGLFSALPAADTGTGLAVEHGAVTLPLAPWPNAAEQRRLKQTWQELVATGTPWQRSEAEAGLAWLKAARARRGPDRIEIELQLLRIGDAAILALPVELFTRFGTAIRACWPGPLLLATMANGYHGYVAASEAYARGTHEGPGVARLLLRRCLRPDCGERLAAAACDFLRGHIPATRACRLGQS